MRNIWIDDPIMVDPGRVWRARVFGEQMGAL